MYRLQEEREKIAQLKGPPNIDPEEAATAIQKVCLTFKIEEWIMERLGWGYKGDLGRGL